MIITINNVGLFLKNNNHSMTLQWNGWDQLFLSCASKDEFECWSFSCNFYSHFRFLAILLSWHQSCLIEYRFTQKVSKGFIFPLKIMLTHRSMSCRYPIEASINRGSQKYWNWVYFKVYGLGPFTSIVIASLWSWTPLWFYEDKGGQVKINFCHHAINGVDWA